VCPVRSHLAASLVGQSGAENNIPAEGVHGYNHEPLHDEAEGIPHQGKRVSRIRSPVLYMRTNQANQRPPNQNQCARLPHRGLAFSPSFAWWEGHCSCSRGTRDCAITTAYLRRRFHDCADNAPQSDRSREEKREPIGLTVSPASAPIMKVAARHDGQSKIDNPLCGSFWRGRWPHQGPVPEVSSAALRWAK
jgi:hypothetical protein